VVDVGCATHGADRSIEPLVERFHPELLLGYDPQVYPAEFDVDGTKVKLHDTAVSDSNGRLRFDGNGLGARFVDRGGRYVRTVDAFELVRALPAGTVFKLDAEGAEFRILERLISTRADAALGLVLVEWHCPYCGHGVWSHAASCDQMDEAEQLAVSIEERLACPVERWEL
jgi:hypothetical protein